MNPRLLGYLRTAATLAVLALLVVYAVARGLDAVSEPFPEKADPPVCVETEVVAGDVLRAGGITVSVVNASETTGLARSTLDALVAQGFVEGEVSNMRDDTITTAEIWSPGGPSAAVRLLRSYLGGKVQVVDREGVVEGVTVVVGNSFPGVRKGKPQVNVTEDSTVCGPAALN